MHTSENGAQNLIGSSINLFFKFKMFFNIIMNILIWFSIFWKAVASHCVQSFLRTISELLYNSQRNFREAVFDSIDKFFYVFCFPRILVDLSFQICPEIFNRSDLWAISWVHVFRHKVDIFIVKCSDHCFCIMWGCQVWPEDVVAVRILLTNKRNQIFFNAPLLVKFSVDSKARFFDNWFW